ncbi:MAG: hypothetical protein RL136_1167 [Planctomycetota bacterium]|jgi:branched-chain amino acid transport system substrate-binding protein
MTNRMRSAGGTVLVALGLLLSIHGGCAGPGADTAASGGSLRLAVVFDDSLGQASLGGEAKRGAMLALEEAGSRAPKAGYFGDAGASEAAQGAVLAVGFTDSDELRVAMPGFAAAGTTLLVAGATDPCLARNGGSEYLRFACFSDPAQGAAMAEFAHARLGVRSATVIFDAQSEFASAVGAAFTSSLRGLSEGQVRVLAYSGSATDAAATAAAAKSDAVYLAALPRDAPHIARALRAAGFSGPVLGPDSFDEADVRAADDLGAVYFSTHAWLGARGEPAIESFVADYRRRFGTEPTAFAALGYDATRIAMRAISNAEQRGAPTRASVAKALDELSDFEGLTGAIAGFRGASFPPKPVWILSAGGGSVQLAARWEPTRIPEPVCAGGR